MKKLIVIASFLLFSFSSYAEGVKGEMICKVKSNYVVSIDEGVSKVYSGIEDSFSKGDNLIFTFNVSELGFAIQFNLKYKDKNLLYSSHSIGDKIELINDDGFSFPEFPTIYAFRSNWINIEGMVETPKIYLKRYYKGDWNGFFTRTRVLDMTEQITTLDCRQSSDKVDDFIQYVRGMAKDG